MKKVKNITRRTITLGNSRIQPKETKVWLDTEITAELYRDILRARDLKLIYLVMGPDPLLNNVNESVLEEVENTSKRSTNKKSTKKDIVEEETEPTTVIQEV